jgi:hypothetical protein
MGGNDQLLKGIPGQPALQGNLVVTDTDQTTALFTVTKATGAVTSAAGLSATTGAFSSTLAVTGASTLTGGAGVGGAKNSKAILSCTSTTLGFLPPVMTGTQRDAISAPTEGLVVYNSSTHKLNVYTGSAWEAVTSA